MYKDDNNVLILFFLHPTVPKKKKNHFIIFVFHSQTKWMVLTFSLTCRLNESELYSIKAMMFSEVFSF